MHEGRPGNPADGPHPVVQVLLDRARAGSRPGLRDAFDVVYVASAGACAGAYFLAGQARNGARLYYEAVNNRRFINPLRTLQRRAIVDLDFLFDEVLTRQLPLDFQTLQQTGIRLVVLASHVDGPDASS